MEFTKASDLIAKRKQLADQREAQDIDSSERAARAGVHILETYERTSTVYYGGHMHGTVQNALKKAGYFVRLDTEGGRDYTYISLYADHPRPHHRFNP